MSYCKQEGKDKIIFVTKEDDAKPSTVTLSEPEEEPGLLLPNGNINWNCPCLGGMATGPCGYEFREAFSCFHYSKDEVKGADCYEQFKKMQECMAEHSSVYGDSKDDDERLDEMLNDENTELSEQNGDSATSGHKVASNQDGKDNAVRSDGNGVKQHSSQNDKVTKDKSIKS